MWVPSEIAVKRKWVGSYHINGSVKRTEKERCDTITEQVDAKAENNSFWSLDGLECSIADNCALICNHQARMGGFLSHNRICETHWEETVCRAHRTGRCEGGG